MHSLIRFVSVGGFSAFTQVAVLEIAVDNYNVDLKLSTTIAYFISVAVHFIGNKYFTFGRVGFPTLMEILRYSTVVFVNYLITLLVTVFFVEKLGQTVLIATLCSILATVTIGYILIRFWVFNRLEFNRVSH